MKPEMTVGALKKKLAAWDDDLVVDWRGSLGQRVFEVEALPIKIPDTGQVVGTVQDGKALWGEELLKSWRLRKWDRDHRHETVPLEQVADLSP